MPKQTDIVGTIRVPEEYYGRFWNFMRSMPTAEFSPITLATEAPAKRTKGKPANGTTGRCIVLNALKGAPRDTEFLQELMLKGGKAPNTLHGLLHGMKAEKQIKRDSRGFYLITPTGREYLETNCNG